MFIFLTGKSLGNFETNAYKNPKLENPPSLQTQKAELSAAP